MVLCSGEIMDGFGLGRIEQALRREGKLSGAEQTTHRAIEEGSPKDRSPGRFRPPHGASVHRICSDPGPGLAVAQQAPGEYRQGDLADDVRRAPHWAGDRCWFWAIV